MTHQKVGKLVVLLAVALVAAAGRAPAAPPEAFDQSRILRRLKAPVASGTKVQVDGLPLVAGMPASLELERFEVFTPDAVIAIHGDDGERRGEVPREQYFRGRVAGDDGSWAFLAVGDGVQGFVVTEGRAFVVGMENDESPSPRRSLVVREFDPQSEFPARQVPFHCETREPPGGISEGLSTAQSERSALFAASPIIYNARVAVDTDYELYQYFGSSAALTSYVGSLFGASSAIYYRDVRTTLQISYLSIWTTASDPWNATSLDTELSEFRSYWNTNRSGVSRNVAHLLRKGGGLGGGIAYLGVLCGGSVGYGVSGSLGGSFSTTNPNGYWDILVVSHEIGHNFNSKHTHCYSPPVDQCYSGEGGCYSGSTSVPPEKGTIMSYCHLLSGGYSNLKLFFGVPGESSQAVTDRMRSYVEGVASCLNVPTPGRGDFNGDTWSDILWRNGTTGQNALWLMNGTTFSSIADLPTIPNVSYVIGGVGDFNGDGKPDILWRNGTTGQNALWLMNGTTFSSIVDLPTIPSVSYAIGGVGDFNGDGKPDIVWRNTVTGQNAIWLMNGTTFSSIVDLPALPNTNYMIGGIGDFDGDGKPDIVWRNAVSGQNAVWLMNGTALKSVVNLPSLPNTNYMIGGIGDFDGDGKPDILWRNMSTGQNAIWLMNGTSLKGIVDLPAIPNLSYGMAGPR